MADRADTKIQSGHTAVALEQRILIADDNATARTQLQQLLEDKLGVVVDTAADGGQALEALLERPYSIVLTDLQMPQYSGMQLLEEIQKRRLPVSVVVSTGHGTIDEAVQAMRLGATDFLTKPIDPDHLRLVVGRVLRERVLQDEVTALRAQVEDGHAFRDVLSKSSRMHEIFELISNVAQTATTVLIQGETGTGKEMIARAIHQASQVRTGPLVAINCAALPETLLESELFGHEKGAFTGAVSQRKGRFELANAGSLFLDEVGDIPAAMQAKLLRVLQERRFERVGGAQSVEVDVRVIAATNRSLRRLVDEGKFREDLFYRLNVVTIDLPPLRERPEDIPILAQHFAHKYGRPGEGARQITAEAMELLLAHSWPGNIRELENAIERASVVTRDGCLRPENLPAEVVRPDPPKTALPMDLSRPLPDQLAALTATFEEQYLRKALEKTEGDVSRVAETAGLSPRSVADKMAAYKIDSSLFRPS